MDMMKHKYCFDYYHCALPILLGEPSIHDGETTSMLLHTLLTPSLIERFGTSINKEIYGGSAHLAVKFRICR